MVNKYFEKVVKTKCYLTQRDNMNESEIKKLEQAIEVHGYRGPSKKRHNGVVPIRPSDKELWKSIRKFKSLEKVTLNGVNIEFMLDVKIVAHIPNGDRAIGSIYKDSMNNLHLYLLGFSNYNYQLY